MQGYYLSVPLTLWLFRPGWLLAGTLIIIATLCRVDRTGYFFLITIEFQPFFKIGVEKGACPPLPPNRTCGSPAYGSPVGGFNIVIGSPVHGLRSR